MMKKRMCGIALVMVVLIMQLSAFASSYATYSVSGGKAVLSDTDNLGEYVTVPETFEGAVIEGIGANSFEGDVNLKSVTLPESVAFIEWGAFENCENLTNVNIPEKVEMIEDMTFSGCKSLAEIKLPAKLMDVGVKSFAGTALKEVVIPEETQAIDIKAFENCDQLEKVTLPAGLVYIGEGAFDGCKNVTVECVKGTYAENYLKANNVSYIAR